jgi:hypothetical protein
MPKPVDGQIAFYAQVRIAAASPVFDRLMSKLDGGAGTIDTDPSDQNGEVKFFSQNLPSLIAATAFREMSVIRTTTDGGTTETVSYSW